MNDLMLDSHLLGGVMSGVMLFNLILALSTEGVSISLTCSLILHSYIMLPVQLKLARKLQAVVLTESTR